MKKVPIAMKTSSTSHACTRQRVIRTILVPVDFSDCSLAGLKYAIKFARNLGARIIVLHVTDLGPVMMTTACGDYDSATYLAAARRRCDDRMQAFLRRVDFGRVPVDALAVAGYCPTAIYEAAAKHAADLIIISTHGRTGLRHALFGSIAEGTVRHAGCPVLVVPSFPGIRKELATLTANRQLKQLLKFQENRTEPGKKCAAIRNSCEA
jgi:nucleotide-binding universal stress UspA family protein